jgi:hypothetical protein
MGDPPTFRRSPYLTDGRLPDLLAAIQTMAIYERYRCPCARWADLISGDESKGSHWQTVFSEHPEFFRPSANFPGDYALVWRRAGASRYHRKLGRVIERDEFTRMTEQDRQRYLSRPPVPEGQLKTLIDTAINLHQRAVDDYRDRRWWITPLVAVLAVIGSFVGAIVGARLKGG